uniref:Uncharacterized protein n=1 Tax=Oncorhynchus tshawytscha TaxID=74940 RepID=A0A8C8J1K1_ONCTS
MHLDFCSPFPQASNMSFASLSRGKKVALSSLGVLTAVGASIALMLHQSVKSSDRVLRPPSYPWTYSSMLSSLDHARLLHLLYVIITCERMLKTCWICFVLQYLMWISGVKAGVFCLSVWNAWPSEILDGGEDYMFSLLTGYCEPLTGVTVREGLSYKPYFPGQAISMAPPIYNETLFLVKLGYHTPVQKMCTSDPKHDQRKQMGLKLFLESAILVPLVFYMKRDRWWDQNKTTSSNAFDPSGGNAALLIDYGKTPHFRIIHFIPVSLIYPPFHPLIFS